VTLEEEAMNIIKAWNFLIIQLWEISNFDKKNFNVSHFTIVIIFNCIQFFTEGEKVEES
jgi:hypothetical protein